MRRLRDVRMARGLTQKEVAKRLGLKDARTVRALEQEGANPTFKTVQAYADALGVSVTLEVEQMRTLTFFNQAGGAGKTSCVRDIGYVLGTMGFKVLLIDADPQSSLTDWMGIDSIDLHPRQTLFRALVDDLEGDDGLGLPEPIHVHGVDLIPACSHMHKADPYLYSAPDGRSRIWEAVRKLDNKYDFVLIDPPPYLSAVAYAAAIAADDIVIPVITNKKGRDGMTMVMDAIKAASRVNPSVRTRMVIPTHADNTNLGKATTEWLQKTVGTRIPVSSPITTRPAVYRDVLEAGQPVSLCYPNSAADQEIRTITDELLSELGVQPQGDF